MSSEHPRVFLVVVDGSAEMRVALRFACLRAKNTGGRVALLRVIEPVDFQHWMGVGELMREEKREEAETLLSTLSEEVVELSEKIPAVYIREGAPRDELLELLSEEPGISVLVLAAGTGKEGPGPLISYLAGKGATRLKIPMTIVPGNLTAEQIDAVT